MPCTCTLHTAGTIKHVNIMWLGSMLMLGCLTGTGGVCPAGQPVTLQANALCQQETGPAASWQLQALDMLPSVPSATFKALELPQIPADKGDSLMTASDLPLEAELALGYTLHGSQDTGSGGLPGSQEVAAARSGSMHSSASTSSQGLPCPEQAQLRWPAIGGPGHAQAQKAANNRGSEGQLQYSRAGHGSQGLVQYRRAISGSQGLLQGNRAGSSGSEEPEEEEERVDPSLPAKERRKASNRLAQRKLQLKRKVTQVANIHSLSVCCWQALGDDVVSAAATGCKQAQCAPELCSKEGKRWPPTVLMCS